MKRIHLVGGAGSGKTTLARFLAEELGLPTYDLDVVGYESGAGAKRQLQTKLDDVHRIAVQPGWVSEGVYLGWTEELFRRADIIVWLDLPFRVAAWRICLRHLKADRRRNNRHAGWRSLVRFLLSVRRYYTSRCTQPLELDDDAFITRRATAEALRPYGIKVRTCHRRTDVWRLTRSLLECR